MKFRRRKCYFILEGGAFIFAEGNDINELCEVKQN
jgi:hypothetical protein